MTLAEPGASSVDVVPRHVLALELAHALALRVGLELERVPASENDLRPAARSIERCLVALYDAFDRRKDGALATDDARQALDQASAELRALVASDPTLEPFLPPLLEARRVLDVADERFARVPFEPATYMDLHASGDFPALHQLERESLSPAFDIPAPLPPPPPPPEVLPKPKTFEELEARRELLRERAAETRRKMAEQEKARDERSKKASVPELEQPQPGFVRGRHVALTHPQLIRDRVRESFEEVVMLGMQRTPLLGDAWRGSSLLERRMFAAIDSIASFGAAGIGALEAVVRDAPAKDPTRAFGAALILGCFDGRDALGAAERTLHVFGGGDPDVLKQFAGGWKIAPHLGIPHLLRAWLGGKDASLRALAVDVLGFRGIATPAELTTAAQDPDPRVVAAALPNLALLRTPDLQALLAPHLGSDSTDVLVAAWTAMAYSNRYELSDVLRAQLRGPHADPAARLLGIFGDHSDSQALVKAMQEQPSLALVSATSWSGSRQALPALLEALKLSDEMIKGVAAFGLERITGARLFEQTLVPPEKVDVPDVEEPDVGEPPPPKLARTISDPRDVPSDGSPDLMLMPTTRIDRWLPVVRDLEKKWSETARYRRGYPYTPNTSLLELDAFDGITPPERRLLQRELIIRTGDHVRFDPHDLVPVQEEAMKSWAPLAHRASSQPGSWARLGRRA